MAIAQRISAQISAPIKRLHQSPAMQPNYPFQPQRVSLFYGWIIVIVTTIGILMSIPGQTAGVSVFTDPLLEATGLSRLHLSNAYLIGTLTSGLLLPFGGVLIDRLGARIVVIGASLWLALTLTYLSWCDRLTAFITGLLNLESSLPVAFVLLAIGFVNLRFSGQGMLTMVSRTTLGKWFDRKRGRVSGTAGIFVSFGFSGAPLILSLLIDAFGWRGAWLFLAAIVGVGMTLIGWLFYRDNPEECGLQMDGETRQVERISDQPAAVSQIRTTRDFSRSEALRTLAFWAVTLALASQALTITGITFHIVDIGASAGLARTQTVALFLPIAIFSTLTGYLIGLMSDRVPLKFLFLAMMVVEAVGIASMAHLDSAVLQWVAIAGLGMSGGCFGTLSTVSMPRYFGRQHLGAIVGVEMMSLVIASAIGPSLLALFKQVFDSYQLGLYLCAAIPLTIIVPLVLSANPQDQVD
ncbi:MAG: MFS transporter [Elainellaceae cyanobacterium]